MTGRRSLHRAASTAPQPCAPDADPRGDDVRLGGAAGDEGDVRRDDVLEEVLGADQDDEVAATIGDLRLRMRGDVEGEVASIRRAAGPTMALDVVLRDGTGVVRCHFFGRDALAGVVVGARLRVSGRLVTYRSRRCLLNPAYELVDGASAGTASS